VAGRLPLYVGVLPEQVVEQLNSIFDDHQLLHAGFWQKVRVSFKNQHFTLIPESLFKREYAEGYLRFSAESLKDTEEVFFYQHANREIVNVFAGEKKVADWFRNTYPSRNVSFVHHTECVHRGRVAARRLRARPEHVHPGGIVVPDGAGHQQLPGGVLQHVFLPQRPDFIYYVMLVMTSLRLNPDTCRVTLYARSATTRHSRRPLQVHPQHFLREQTHRPQVQLPVRRMMTTATSTCSTRTSATSGDGDTRQNAI
jgi:hypothetical protein